MTSSDVKDKEKTKTNTKKRVPCVPCLHCLPVSRCASSSFWSLFKSTRLKCIKYNIHTCPIKHCKDCEWCPLSSLSMVTSLLDFSLRLPLSLSLSLLKISKWGKHFQSKSLYIWIFVLFLAYFRCIVGVFLVFRKICNTFFSGVNANL